MIELEFLGQKISLTLWFSLPSFFEYFNEQHETPENKTDF